MPSPFSDKKYKKSPPGVIPQTQEIAEHNKVQATKSSIEEDVNNLTSSSNSADLSTGRDTSFHMSTPPSEDHGSALMDMNNEKGTMDNATQISVCNILDGLNGPCRDPVTKKLPKQKPQQPAKDVNELGETNAALYKANGTLKKENKQLKDKNTKLERENQELKTENSALKEQLPQRDADRLPKEPRILWDDWKQLPENKGKNAFDCLKEVWGDLLEAGNLYQFDLSNRKDGGLDPALLKAMKNYCSNHKIPLKTHPDMPPPKRVSTDRKAQHADKDSVRATETARRRKYR